MSTQKTPLYNCHAALKAQMVVFADTLLPLRYESEKEEHKTVRNAVGLFDVSHMGEFMVEGADARAFLQKMLTRDVSTMKPGKALYALLLNENAGILEDLIVYCLAEQSFMLCVNAANIASDWQWLYEHAAAFIALDLRDVSLNYAQLALQGPKAMALLSSLCQDPLPKRFCCKELAIGMTPCLVARTGYTGEDGVEIFVDAKRAEELWHTLIEKGQDYGLKPCGLAARDSLRLEAGLLLHGTDINKETTPLEANLGFAVDMNNKQFIGRAAHEAQISKGIKQKICGFRMLERGIARHGFPILDTKLCPIGVVTSGTWPESQKLGIGLALMQAPIPAIGSEVCIDIRNRVVKALITAPIFLRG